MTTHCRWKLLIVLTVALAGCNAETITHTGGPVLLSMLQLDRITAGSADATANVASLALGPAPHTTSSANTLAFSGPPMAEPPFLDLPTPNYASAQLAGTAGNGLLSQAVGSTHISVSGGGKAAIDAATAATAAGSFASQAQVNMQFYGLSISPQVDFALGTATAAACCAPVLGASTTVDGTGAGYWRVLEAFPVATVPGQVQSQAVISVVSSTLPILDAGQAAVLVGPGTSQSFAQ